VNEMSRVFKVKGFNSENITIPHHAIGRGRSRANKKGNSIIRFAKKSLAYGMNFNNTDGKMLDFIKSKYQCYYDANAIAVYGHDTFIWKRRGNQYVLKTVLDLPKYLWEEWAVYSRENLKGDEK
jgi:hypothetical protein